MPNIEDYAKRLDIRGIMVTSIITALGFVVALLWNDAIRALIESIFPQGDTISAKIMVALIVTIAVSIVIYVIYKIEMIYRKNVKIKKR